MRCELVVYPKDPDDDDCYHSERSFQENRIRNQFDAQIVIKFNSNSSEALMNREYENKYFVFRLTSFFLFFFWGFEIFWKVKEGQS